MLGQKRDGLLGKDDVSEENTFDWVVKNRGEKK
jgi:hypothetical protein